MSLDYEHIPFGGNISCMQ